jgi:transcriptional regulator with XRE-family HTH domain
MIWYSVRAGKRNLKGRYVKLDSAKVRWHRDRLGWTLDTLAEQAEVAEGTALRAEHGEDIRPSSGRRIARAFGVDISELVPEKPGATRPKVAASPPSPPKPAAEEEWRETPSLEWALAAPDKEFESWIETAKVPELHKVMALLNAEAVAAGKEGRSQEERAHILNRATKTNDKFFKETGPITDWIDWRQRTPAEREDQETA